MRRMAASVMPSPVSRTTYWTVTTSRREYRRWPPSERDGRTTPNSSRRRRNACCTSSMPETCPTVYRGRSSSSNGNDGTVIHSLAQTTSKGRGPGAHDAPGPHGDALPSGSDLLLALGVDLDLAGLSGRQQRQADGQHAVGEVGLDLVEVDLVAKGETPGEGAGHPLAGNQLLVLTGLLGALRAHREHAAVHRDVDGLGVHAGQVEAEQDLVLAPDHVHRHGRPHPGGPVGRAEGAPGDAVELHEGVE